MKGFVMAPFHAPRQAGTTPPGFARHSVPRGKNCLSPSPSPLDALRHVQQLADPSHPCPPLPLQLWGCLRTAGACTARCGGRCTPS